MSVVTISMILRALALIVVFTAVIVFSAVGAPPCPHGDYFGVVCELPLP